MVLSPFIQIVVEVDLVNIRAVGRGCQLDFLSVNLAYDACRISRPEFKSARDVESLAEGPGFDR